MATGQFVNVMSVIQTIKKILPNPLKGAYYIGFLNREDINLPVKERYSKINWIKVGKYSKEGWFADPFIVSVKDDEVVIFAEEMIYKTGKGILAKLVINRHDMSIKSRNSLLELDTHLSFPIFIKENGKMYVYPENYQSGCLKIYEYDDSKKKLIYIKDIIKEPLADTQIVKIDNTYYAFGVKITTGFQDNTKSLLIYQADSLLGEYRYFQTIENKKCEERGAGLIYIDEMNRLIRPVQSCEGGYGKCVILYHLQFNDGKFTEKEIGRIEPDGAAQYGKVLHTFNCMNGLCVIDGNKDTYPLVSKIYKKFRGIKD